jgi:hypothetical protein
MAVRSESLNVAPSGRSLDLTRHDGSVAQVYLMLVATTPLTGRALLWVLAPKPLAQQPAPTVAPGQPGQT